MGPPLITAATVALGAAAYVGRELFPEQFLQRPEISPVVTDALSQFWGYLTNLVTLDIPVGAPELTTGSLFVPAKGEGIYTLRINVGTVHERIESVGYANRSYVVAKAYDANQYFNGHTGPYQGGIALFSFSTNPQTNQLEKIPHIVGTLLGYPVDWANYPNQAPYRIEYTSTNGDVSVPANQEFVGNPPRTKVPLRRKAAVLPQTKAAVTPLPLPNPSRVIPPITEDQPNDTPQPSREFQPQTEPTPAKPTVVPSVFPSPVRTTPTQPDGKPLPVTAAKPTPTPKDAHVVNNQIIPANGPQPSLDGIAKEVGRIESKMASVMKSAPLKDPLEWDEIIAILRLLKDLFDGITDDEPQSAYQISSPCELDDQEQRIVFASTIAASTDKFGAIINRINAVADLLQHSKNLKQPLCPGQRFPVSGQAVTVNFTQID